MPDSRDDAEVRVVPAWTLAPVIFAGVSRAPGWSKGWLYDGRRTRLVDPLCPVRACFVNGCLVGLA